MSKRGKLITLILLVIAMIVISFLVLLGLPQKNIEEDYRLTNEAISKQEEFELPNQKKLNLDDIDNETFERYIDEITNSFIHVESEIGTLESKSWYDEYMEMQVKSYYKEDNLYKIYAYDKSMNFEIYYWDNKVTFILAVPTEYKDQKNENGEIIGYRMFFVENTMIASMDLDGNSVDPKSADFKTMEDFALRLSYYFTLINIYYILCKHVICFRVIIISFAVSVEIIVIINYIIYF
jgi:hypothetical protein